MKEINCLIKVSLQFVATGLKRCNGWQFACQRNATGENINAISGIFFGIKIIEKNIFL